MSKIFGYELRRLLGNKLFFGVLLVTLGYAWVTLTGSVIQGVANTAPFSPWSFGYYLSQTMPLICLGELFFLAFFSSKEERLLQPLTQATPVKERPYMVLRCGAVLTAIAILCLCVVALAIAFYVSLFGWMNYGELILPALLTLIPPVLFCLGAGLVLSRLHPVLLYALMVAVLLLFLLPLPSAVSFSLCSFFSQFPLTLSALDPAFRIPGWLAACKILLAILGLFLAILATGMRKKKAEFPNAHNVSGKKGTEQI